MNTFETITQVETQVCMLERARAVLAEVEQYFEDNSNAKRLAHYAEHILLLLYVADGLLHDISPELTTVVNELLEHHKAEKEEKTA